MVRGGRALCLLMEAKDHHIKTATRELIRGGYFGLCFTVNKHAECIIEVGPPFGIAQ